MTSLKLVIACVVISQCLYMVSDLSSYTSSFKLFCSTLTKQLGAEYFARLLQPNILVQGASIMRVFFQKLEIYTPKNFQSIFIPIYFQIIFVPPKKCSYAPTPKKKLSKYFRTPKNIFKKFLPPPTHAHTHKKNPLTSYL